MTGKNDFPTLSDLKEELRKYEFKPSKARGQNFLFDHNTLRRISEQIPLTLQDTVLEVGPGSGFLTLHLAQTAGCILAVELDSILSSVAQSFLKTRENVEIMNTDILKNDNLSSAVINRLQELNGCSTVVGNLPYSAATAIISAFAQSSLQPRHLVFLLQEEVARRLTASPGNSNYCSSSVITTAAYDSELLQRIGPNVFWPKPKVYSRLVRFKPVLKVRYFSKFAAFVHTLFARPRKTAVNSYLEGISQLPAGKGKKSSESLRNTVTGAIQSLGLSPQTRPGRLDFSQIHSLYKKLVPETLK